MGVADLAFFSGLGDQAASGGVAQGSPLPGSLGSKICSSALQQVQGSHECYPPEEARWYGAEFFPLGSKLALKLLKSVPCKTCAIDLSGKKSPSSS
jgi:hypothetical protein